MKARRGIYAAAVTPFNADGTVNTAAHIAYCQHLLSDGGCDGVAPTGTTGEGTSVTLSDRIAMPAAFAKAGIETDRVIFGTGAPASGDSVALTKASCDAGFTNVLVLPPYYYKTPSDDGLYAYYARLIESVARDDLRIYVYHFPQMSAVPLSVDLVLRLKKDFGAIMAGLKDSSGDFSQSAAFIEATGGVDADFDVYPSSEAMLWDGLSMGSAGVISGSTNGFGALAQTALNAPEGAERDAAMAKVKAARAMASKYPLMAGMKQMEAWRSGDDNWTRMAPPLMPLSDQQRADLRADIDAFWEETA
ncbi:dihydrodipicolinate synthase family protein [Planktotalea sp.]|uniref:dihydrodipicolinate synthase family protein n=1 Tax=Planktotalea sp. TaxID=2029877 RepID=UPI0032978F98